VVNDQSTLRRANVPPSFPSSLSPSIPLSAPRPDSPSQLVLELVLENLDAY